MNSQPCQYCNKQFESVDKRAKFCSRSCAASYNNTISPKRKLAGRCKVCETSIPSSLGYCKLHTPTTNNYRDNGFTIGEYRNKLHLQGKHPSWVHAQVRQFARTWNKELRTQPCEICGYSKHVELAHVTPLSSFPDDALLSEINSPDNIRVLCPNHHWEFDNGMLD